MVVGMDKSSKETIPGKVSVIVVSYNSMEHIETCLTSLTKQTYPNYEVIFVDNNSSDGSIQYAQSRFPNLKFVNNDANVGYAVGINSALPYCAGEFIAPLNIDKEVAQDWLATMVEFLKVKPGVGAVTPKILLFDDRKRINTMGHNVHVTGLGFCRRLYELDNNYLNPERVSGVSGCSYLIRRDMFERIGGAPEDSFMSNDDVIVSWLIHLLDFEIYCLPASIVFHKYRLKMDPGKLFRLEKDRGKLVLSMLKPLTLVVMSPIFLVVELMILAYCLVKGRAYTRAKLSSLASLWRERHIITERRKQYKTLRKISDRHLLSRLRWGLEWGQLFGIMG